jgi:DNA mismatch endonuclease (patch repair protein)
VFVPGCFWHRHEGCRYATTPATRPGFWKAKFAANVARDADVRTALIRDGWRVATVWECALREHPARLANGVKLASWIRSSVGQTEIG